MMSKKGRVTGIGGVFFKCKDTKETMNWYQRHLGLKIDGQHGTSFEWREANNAEKTGYTAWSPFKDTSDYFGNSDQQFMINYRVENIEELVEQLKQEGVVVLDSIESYEYGKFVHVQDLNGNKIELWEAQDEEYKSTIGSNITN